MDRMYFQQTLERRRGKVHKKFRIRKDFCRVTAANIFKFFSLSSEICGVQTLKFTRNGCFCS